MDGRVWVLEGFVYARRVVARAYEAENHLLTEHAQLECQPDGTAKLRVKVSPDNPIAAAAEQPSASHDRAKSRLIPANASWLRALGVTNDRGLPREGMSDKFRQIDHDVLHELAP